MLNMQMEDRLISFLQNGGRTVMFFGNATWATYLGLTSEEIMACPVVLLVVLPVMLLFLSV